jgi:hypothetical protein
MSMSKFIVLAASYFLADTIEITVSYISFHDGRC